MLTAAAGTFSNNFRVLVEPAAIMSRLRSMWRNQLVWPPEPGLVLPASSISLWAVAADSHTVPLALMSLPTACSVRQAQLTSLWVSTVFHKWQRAKISGGNEGSRVNKKAAVLYVYSGCISVFVEGCIGLLSVYLLCTNTKPVEKAKQMSSAAKIFFPLFSKTFWSIIFYYTVCEVTAEQGGGRWGLVKNRIVMGLGWEVGGTQCFPGFSSKCFSVPLSNWEKAINVHSLWEGNCGKRLASEVITHWVKVSVLDFAFYLHVFSVLSIRESAVRIRRIWNQSCLVIQSEWMALWTIVSF